MNIICFLNIFNLTFAAAIQEKTTGCSFSHKDQMGDEHLLPGCSLLLHQAKSGHVEHNCPELFCYII